MSGIIMLAEKEALLRWKESGEKPCSDRALDAVMGGLFRKAVKRAKGLQSRPWIKVGALDSYESSDNRVEVHVRMGSPAQGMIVLNYGMRRADLYDMEGRRTAIFQGCD